MRDDFYYHFITDDLSNSKTINKFTKKLGNPTVLASTRIKIYNEWFELFTRKKRILIITCLDESLNEKWLIQFLLHELAEAHLLIALYKIDDVLDLKIETFAPVTHYCTSITEHDTMELFFRPW